MKIERLEKYMAEESRDFEIDKAHLTSCLMRLPNLHSKWLRRLMMEQGRYLKMEDARRKLFREKHEFYLTKFEIEIKPNQLSWYIEADEQYSKILLKISIQKKIVDYLERIMDKIKNQNYILRNITDWEKFKSGV